MRLAIIGFLLVGLTAPALAIDKAEVDKRIHLLTAKFEEMQAKPDKRIPAENLRKAQGLIMLDRIKAGFVFAYQGGGGLAMVRDAKSGRWSSPAFLVANEASLGFQIGGQQAFTVILVMKTNATRALTESSIDFGGEASGTAGNSSGAAESTTSSDYKPMLMVYNDATGLYGGATIKGGALAPDVDANVAYYGQYLTPSEILFGQQGKPTEATTNLVQRIAQFSQ
jgi:lipid-binding SYLF domain-containing protein